MAEERGMGLETSTWRRAMGSKVARDLLPLPCLGLAAYLLFRHAESIQPAEGAVLIMAAAGLVRMGFHGWDWYQGLSRDGSFLDWVHRVRRGEREPLAHIRNLREGDRQVVAALNDVIGDTREGRAGLEALRHAVAREWKELDGLLEEIQLHHTADGEARTQGAARLSALGRDLKRVIEDTLKLDQIELNHRLRTDQHRLQGQAFQATLDQICGGLEQFETLLEELQDTFPRIRREEEALGRLAGSGLRQGARLSLSVKGLVAHAPRLVEESRSRMAGLRRFRIAADGLRDQTEALIRRIEGFREEAHARIRSFTGAQSTMKGLDQVAQQTGLLAVNASILAQQGGGSAGMAEIGGRLRALADQTAAGASGMERALDQYREGLDHEAAGLWDLQEVGQKLLSAIHEVLRVAGHLDQQGHDLERALENHLGMVERAREATERAERSLHEIGERARAMEAVHGHQWSVEAKLAPERERLSRLEARLSEVGSGLARIAQQNVEETWDILARHQEVRRTETYQQATSGDLSRVLTVSDSAALAWKRIGWSRALRRSRLMDVASRPPLGYRDSDGALRLRLLGQDALGRAEPSALESWDMDITARIWDLRLAASLCTESHRLALLEQMKESPLPACFPGLEMRISSEGAQIRLPHSYPGLPHFLMGLRLELPLEQGLWDHPFRQADLLETPVQAFVWIGPGAGGGLSHPGLRLLHAWVRDDSRHEGFLPWLPYEGHRPPCPLQEDQGAVDLGAVPPSVMCLGLGADAALLHPLRERLLQMGASEGPGGMVLGAVGIGHAHPEALLLRLFQQDVDLAGALHPELAPYQTRLREDVLAAAGDPYRAAWALLEDLQRKGWLMPLPIM